MNGQQKDLRNVKRVRKRNKTLKQREQDYMNTKYQSEGMETQHVSKNAQAKSQSIQDQDQEV